MPWNGHRLVTVANAGIQLVRQNGTRMIMTLAKPHDDRYENALDDVIAQCGGDTRGALMALLVANEYLETQLNTLQAAIESGEVPLHSEKGPRTRLH